MKQFKQKIYILNQALYLLKNDLLKTKKEDLSRLEAEIKGMRKIEDTMGEEVNALRSRKDDLFKERTQLEAQKDSLEAKIETAKDFSIDLETKLSLTQDRLREVNEEIEQYEVEAETPLPTVERLKRIIKECEADLSRMGAVNLKAIDDYQGKKDRHDELSDEVERLEEQRADLLELMHDLNERKKTVFLRVFEAVGKNFERIYADLWAVAKPSSC